MRDTLAKSKELAKVRVKTSIGTGTALVGNIGSKAHLSFSIIGPVMLFTSALCKLNAFLGTDILISSITWRDVKEHFIAKIVCLRLLLFFCLVESILRISLRLLFDDLFPLRLHRPQVAPVDIVVPVDPQPLETLQSFSEQPAGDGTTTGGTAPVAWCAGAGLPGSLPSPTATAKLCAVTAEQKFPSYTEGIGSAELRRMFAVQLLRGVDGSTDGEWCARLCFSSPCVRACVCAWVRIAWLSSRVWLNKAHSAVGKRNDLWHVDVNVIR